MSSINPYFTFHYSQPEEYHFSHDSVFLARQVFEQLSGKDLHQKRALDLCSGVGVVGLDFLFHRLKNGQSTPGFFDFLEVQEIYQPHFMENAKSLGAAGTELSFVNRNYNDLQKPPFLEAYDLILSNPPYFFTWQGKLSPSEFKNRCRFFIDSDFKNLFYGIAAALKKSGEAYVLLRDLPEHKWDVLAEARHLCTGKLDLEVLGDIRGTHFVRLTSWGGGDPAFTKNRRND